jgi:hypothetical protein
MEDPVNVTSEAVKPDMFVVNVKSASVPPPAKVRPVKLNPSKARVG